MKELGFAVCGKKQGDIMKKELLKRHLTVLVFAIALGFAGSTTYSQESECYVPLLPKVRERMLPVDYSKGYLVKEIKPDVYIITDGAYQSMFVTLPSTPAASIGYHTPQLRRAAAKSPKHLGRQNIG